LCFGPDRLIFVKGERSGPHPLHGGDLMDHPGGFLDHTIVRVPAQALVQGTPPHPPSIPLPPTAVPIALPFAPISTLAVGEAPPRLPGYTLLGLLGRGGFATVYYAHDPRSQRCVALKVLEAKQVSPETVARFEREAILLEKLDHPNIINVYEYGRHEGLLYLAMPQTAGSLDAHLTRFVRNERTVVVMMEKVARALHYAHEQGVIHRDLKPGNILLDRQAEPLIADFGLASADLVSQSWSRREPPFGTPAYISPERFEDYRAFGPSSDIWAMGVILYELLSGQRPFAGNTVRQIADQVFLCLPTPIRALCPNINPALEAIVARCLQLQPRNRYQSAESLAEDLRRCLHGQPLSHHTTQPRSLMRFYSPSAAVAVLGSLLLFGGLTTAVSPLGLPSKNAQPALVNSLRRGESVCLVGENGPPDWHRWHVGPTELEEGRPVELESGGWSILELLPEVPCDRFRVEADVQIATAQVSQAGFFFSYRNLRGKEGTDMRFTTASVSRLHGGLNPCLTLVHAGRDEKDHVPFFNRRSLAKRTLPDPEPLYSWHRMAVEVTPGRTRLYWDGVLVGETTPADIADHVAFEVASRNGDANGVNVPSFRGPFGIFVFVGTVRFHHIILQPLAPS
jgi:serine/threonine protein kinase